MNKRAKRICLAFAIFVLPIVAGFGARILSLYLIGAMFDAWSLTDISLAYAPLWVQRLAYLSGDIADLCFLVFLTLPLFLYLRKERARFRKMYFAFPLAGIALSILTVGVFLMTGSARMPKIRTFPFFGASLLYASVDFFSVCACAYLARKACGKVFPKRRIFRMILSALIQTTCWMISKKSFSVCLIFNACLSGILLFRLYEKTKSVLPEILLVYSFRFFTRFVFGFPDLGGAYPVSEPLLTGGMGGVSHSLMLGLYLLIVLMLVLWRSLRARSAQKGEDHVSA